MRCCCNEMLLLLLLMMMIVMMMMQVGRVLHKAMKGGLQGDSQAGLTAYIVISLLEANVSTAVCFISAS